MIISLRPRLLTLPRRIAVEVAPENPRAAEKVLDREIRATPSAIALTERGITAAGANDYGAE
jgi:hypothetical protein